jgi:hypothetical protein
LRQTFASLIHFTLLKHFLNAYINSILIYYYGSIRVFQVISFNLFDLIKDFRFTVTSVYQKLFFIPAHMLQNVFIGVNTLQGKDLKMYKYVKGRKSSWILHNFKCMYVLIYSAFCTVQSPSFPECIAY